MSQYAQVNVKFGADISQFSTAMQNAARQMQKAGQQLQDVGKSLTMNLTAPIVALGAASLYAFGQIDALKRGLISFAGSAEAAEVEFNKLREVAKLPGIGLEEAVKGSINLQAIGMSADDARTAMQAFGNAIATVGGGKENFDLAIRGFGQLQNAAKPLQQDLYQIANQLPQVNKLMIEAFGTNRAEDLAEMGMSGKQLADFLITELGKLPKVTGGIKNAFENMGDSVKIALGKMGEAIETNFKISDKLNAFADLISRMVEGFGRLNPEVQKIILVFVGLVAAIGPLLLVIGSIVQILPVFLAGFAAIQGAVLALTVTFAPLMLEIGLLLAAIAAMVTIGVFLYSNWEAVKVNMINLFKDLARSILGAIKIMVDGLDWLFSKFGNNTFGTMSALFDGMIDNVAANEKAKEFKTIGQSFTDTWQDVKNALMKPITVGKIETAETKTTDTKKGGGSGQAPKQFDIIEMDSKKLSENYLEKELAITQGWQSINEAEFNGGEQYIETSNKTFDKYIQSFTQFKNQLDNMMKDFIVNTIADFAASIGEAFANKEDPFKNWGHNMLGALGGLMQQMGALFIAWGINFALFKDSITSMNPYLAIAAGVALVGIGAAISASSKRGLDGGGSSSSGGYSSGSRGVSEDMTLTTRIDGRDLVLSGQRTTAIGRR